ncbi:hypothetical protein Tco_1007227 [Tanacetum coccineum]
MIKRIYPYNALDAKGVFEPTYTLAEGWQAWRSNPTSGIRARFAGFSGYLGSILKGFLVFQILNDKGSSRLSIEKGFVDLGMFEDPQGEEDQKDQEDGDDEDAGDQESDQPPDLTDYQLARDKEPMTRMKPLRFRDESNMAAYAFVAAEEEDTHEPLTYHEAVACEDSSK